MFKNILCPIDVQSQSKMTLSKAIHIANQFIPKGK